MKKGGGKQSGNSYEREWSRKISLWLTNNQRDDCVWRTSNSGGKATSTNSDTQCSDIHAVRPEAQIFFDIFVVELKNYKSSAINLLHFTKDKFLLYTWWEQVLNDSNRAKKYPILIFNLKRQGEWFVFEDFLMAKLINLDILNSTIYTIPHIGLHNSKYMLRIMPIKYFFDSINLHKVSKSIPLTL